MIAGLEPITSGEIQIDGRRVNEAEPIERGVAMVFQNYALYPHMTVEQNIGFSLRMAGLTRTEIAGRVAAAARTLQVEELLKRKPGQLSGGQRQRVAIGRAIVRDPEVFLFDEPLTNLDAELRVSMRVEIAKLHQQLGSTMIYVTHDQTEAMTLADKIVVMRAGKVEQAGTPDELYDDPANLFVAGFIGSPRMNFLRGKATSGSIVLDAGGTVAGTGSGDVQFGIRPEHFEIGGSDAPLSRDRRCRREPRRHPLRLRYDRLRREHWWSRPATRRASRPATPSASASGRTARWCSRPKASGCGPTEMTDLELWYNEPAAEWTEALPLGNGRLGAMVFGGSRARAPAAQRRHALMRAAPTRRSTRRRADASTRSAG